MSHGVISHHSIFNLAEKWQMKQFWYMATSDTSYWLWSFLNGHYCWIIQGSIALTNEIKLSKRKMWTEYQEILPVDELGIKSDREVPVEEVGGHLTPTMHVTLSCSELRQFTSDWLWVWQDDEWDHISSFIDSLILVYIHSLTSPMDRISVCVKFSDYRFLFSRKHSF